MNIRVVTEKGNDLESGFLLRLPGWTEERFFADAPESSRWEYKDGEVIVHSPANIRHQQLVRFLLVLLTCYVEERELGEVLQGPAVLHLRSGSAKEPDIFFVGREGISRIGHQAVEGAADLVIEVLSPETRRYDQVEKAQDYLEAGVREYWIVDSESRQVRKHTPRAGRSGWTVQSLEAGRLASAAVPGFWIDVGWLWEDPLPKPLAKLGEILGPAS